VCDKVTDRPPATSYTDDRNKNYYYYSGGIEMNPVIAFLASSAGRVVRALAGLALIVWGLVGIGGTGGIIVAVIGALPLLAGIFDFCIFAPLFGAPFSGSKIRAGK
jgi:hypothetical protein